MNHHSALQSWLNSQLPTYQLEALPFDASFRRYFRVQHAQGSYIAMDASLEIKSCVPYVAIANAFRKKGLCAPEIIASDLTQGFLLLSDFGNCVYLNELNLNNARELYGRALDSLAILQTCRKVEHWQVPLFTADFMRQELELFKEWFLQKHLGLELLPHTEKMLAECFNFLAESAASQPQVFMHRDYHSANLMVLPERSVGILDFQDAFMGPVTYDLVSLLRDCYIAWPEELVTELVLQYRKKLSIKVSESEFLRWFDLMGLQRHLKALLTFARKYRRDGNANYLQHIPRTLNYILNVSQRYEPCQALYNFLKMENLLCVP